MTVSNADIQVTEVINDPDGAGLRLDEGVVLVTGEGMTRLLDFGRGRFYGLDEVSSRALTACLDGGPEAAVARVTEEYDVDEGRARRDVGDLLDDLRRKRLLAPAGGRPRRFVPSAVAVAWVVSALLGRAAALAGWLRPGRSSAGLGLRREAVRRLLALIWISLRVLGWSATVALLRGLPRRRVEVEPGDCAAVVDAVDRLVREAAAATFFLPAACKERALVGYRILEGWYGLPAAIVVGVQRQPFIAHAWVECEDRVVTDDPERCEPFTPVLRIGSASRA